MKSILKLAAFTPLLVCVLLVPRSGVCFYNASSGRWLSRDPVEEQGGSNLYGLLANDAVSRVDRLGLWSLFGKKCCCCCAEDVQIQDIEPFQFGLLFGHRFDAVIKLSYKLGPAGDCTLQWFETTDVPYTDAMMKNVPTDMTKDPQTKPHFTGWAARKKPCPGSEPVKEWDEAKYSTLHQRSRTIDFLIIVTSAPGCPCTYPKREVTAKQTLDPSETPWVQEFVTPSS